MSFQDKVVLVTGASSGIGAIIAIKFSAEGAKVVLVGRNQEKLNKVASKCGNPLVIIADLSKDEDVKRIVNDTIQHFGQLDVLVNSAGFSIHAGILENNAIDVFDRIMATNIRGPVLITSLAVPHILKTKGNIINISSVASVRTFPENFAYPTSKAALDQFSRAIALELAPHGVRVNTVNPGPCRTDILENMGLDTAQAEAFYENMKTMTALNRISDPEEIADVVLFLASDKAKAVTGASYYADNGMTIIK